MINVNPMERDLFPGEFVVFDEFGQYKSSIAHLQTFIQDRPLINAPVRKIIRKEASRRSGFITMDTEEYEDTKLELTLYTEALPGESYHSKRDQLYDLFNKGYYVDVMFYFDPDKFYRVMLDDEATQFENKYYYNDGQSWRVHLTVHPWKKLIDTIPYHINEPTKIVNPTLHDAKPKIEIVGKGKMELDLRGQLFKMGEIPSSGIILDSETSNAYAIHEGWRVDNLNEYVYTREFPVLEPGETIFDWNLGSTGTIQEVIIEPRWRTLL